MPHFEAQTGTRAQVRGSRNRGSSTRGRAAGQRLGLRGATVATCACQGQQALAEIIRRLQADDTELQSTVLAGALMAHMAGNLREKFDTFATWLLAGFGAAVGLLLSNDKASTLETAPMIRSGTELFVWAMCVTVVEKYLAIIVAASSEAAAFSRTTFKEYLKERREAKLSETLSMQTFVKEFVRPIFKPAAWLASIQIRKVMAGDLNAGARPMVIISQTQGALLLVEIGLFVAAIVKVVAALPK